MQNFSSQINNQFFFSLVSECAKFLGIEVYVIGGYVRDLFLKRESKDIDFVCTGSGIKLAKEVVVRLKGKANLSVYKNFGTASIRHQDFIFEFVGARKESYRADSRNPIVEEGTLEDDQNRRDFTINTMAISLNEKDYGTLLDPFGGLADLGRKIIKTPLQPQVAFSDDPLRMMRAVRFSSQLSFDIEENTFQGIIDMHERISIISQERITDELQKIILSFVPSYGFKLLYHAKLLEIIFPKLVNLRGVEKINGIGHKDNFYHTLQVLDNISLQTDNVWLRWVAILHDIAKPSTKLFHKKSGWTFHGHEDLGAKWIPEIFKKMKLPLDERMRYVQKLVRLHLRPIALVKEAVTDSAIRRLLFEATGDIEDLMLLCKADITSKNPEKVKRYKNNFRLVEEKIKQVEERDRLINFHPPVTGEEIMEHFNIPPCKLVGEIKSEIKEAILEGKIPNEKKDALILMLKIGKNMGLETIGK